MKLKVTINSNDQQRIKDKIKDISILYDEDFLLPNIAFIDIDIKDYSYLKSISGIRVEKESYGYLMD